MVVLVPEWTNSTSSSNVKTHTIRKPKKIPYNFKFYAVRVRLQFSHLRREVNINYDKITGYINNKSVTNNEIMLL